MLKTIILCPLYNDEASFNIFATKVENEVGVLENQQFSFLIINDGSSEKPALITKIPITVVHLCTNIGHQKAIAIGLAYAHHNMTFDQLVIMDADGEDKPEFLKELIQTSIRSKQVVFAHRATRQDGRQFKFFYSLYKILFQVFTGKKISFGNFMLLPKKETTRLVYSNDSWNHIAAAILKSGVAYEKVATHKGKRYSGRSNMNISALMLHGLGAIGVFIDIIAVRLLIFSLFMIGLSVLCIAAILIVRFFTTAAIPGWATTAFSAMVMVLLQSFLLSLFTIFLYMSSQSQRQFIPAHHYKDYIASIEKNE